MPIVKIPCEPNVTLNQALKGALRYDADNDCYFITTIQEGSATTSTPSAQDFVASATDDLAANTIKSVTFVVLTGVVVFSGVTFAVGQYTYTEQNGGVFDTVMSFDTTGGTGFFMLIK